MRKGKRFTKNKEFIRSQTVNPLTSERKNKGGAANNPEGVEGGDGNGDEKGRVAAFHQSPNLTEEE